MTPDLSAAATPAPAPAPIPLLLFSDSPAGSTGLGRITRDLALRIHADPATRARFRLGVYGIGGPITSSTKFPFFNCSVRQLDQMIPTDLELVYRDFAGVYGDGLQPDSADDLAQRHGQLRKGITLNILNASWAMWLARPDLLPANYPLREFLLTRPFRRWLYCPVDGHCADGTLGHQLAPVLAGMDRLLGYTGYGSRVMERTLERWSEVSQPPRLVVPEGAITPEELDKIASQPGKITYSGETAPPVYQPPSIPHLPHGLDTQVFYPRPRAEARAQFFARVSGGQSQLPLLDDQIVLAAVATNSLRKNWGLAFATCAELLQRGHQIFLWAHTNTQQGHWNLRALARQFGMERRVYLTTDKLSDETMAWAYSAADCGLHIGDGEGFGYFGPEAVACGLPVVHGNYAGGVEFVPWEGLVPPIGFTQEGTFFILRPTFSPAMWAQAVEGLLRARKDGWQPELPQPLAWDEIWPRWREWLLQSVDAGVEDSQ